MGERGEEFACDYLKKSGYHILERNWRCDYGELDIVCRKGAELIVVEVKSRFDTFYARKYLFENITRRKKMKLALLTEVYWNRFRRRSVYKRVRIDVIGVLLTDEGELSSLRHLRAAVAARSELSYFGGNR